MNKLLKQILILIILTAVLILPYFVFAQDSAALDKLKEVGEGQGRYATYDELTFAKMSGTVVKAFLSLLGVIFIVLMIYAGHLWMTARGNEDQLTKAKTTIRVAIIGLIIIVGSYAIWAFVAKYVL